MKTKILAIVLALIGFSQAQASFLVEPYLGYQSATLDMELGAASAPFNGQTISQGFTGSQLGLKLGYEFPVVSLALDYSMANLSGSIKSQPAGFNLPSSDVKRNSLGLTLGANLLLVKPYIGYIFDDQAKGDNATDFGTGLKIGVGFSIIPFVKLNLEYQTMTYTKSEGGGTTTTYGANEAVKSIKGSGFGLIVSAPFSF